MSEKPKTGGPAYPTPYHPQDGMNTHLPTGMTLRDYFAAKAMQAFVTRGNTGLTEANFDDEIAKWSYQVADGMLRGREAQ